MTGRAPDPVRPPGWYALPSVVREVAGVIGLDAALELVKAVAPPVRRPGSRNTSATYIPASRNVAGYRRLRDIVGEANADLLCDEFGGTFLHFSSCAGYFNRDRDAAIREAWRNGLQTAGEIARHHGISERQVRNVCQGVKRLRYIPATPARVA